MGTKRIGLARMEALMEGLKRDLNLVSTTLTNCTITTNVNATFTGTTCITLGNTAQSAGVCTAKIGTGILNAPIVYTKPAAAGSSATGAHTLTPANIANGYVTVTANATSVAVTLPTKAHWIELFGPNRVVGDSMVWYLHNAGTTVNQSLVLTPRTGVTILGQTKVAANAADNETATVGGTSTGAWMTRLTNTDGSCVTHRLS